MENDGDLFDLCVIGSGPAGQKAAIQATKLGRRVCLVERSEVVGGVAINTGTIPSKALREAVVNLTGHVAQANMGMRYEAPKQVSVDDLAFWSQRVVTSEIAIVRSHLKRNGVELLHGAGSFIDQNSIQVARQSAKPTVVRAKNFLIATGTAPARPDHIPFDGAFVVDADSITRLNRMPRTVTVVGGGVIGTEYASMLQTLGARVTLVEARSKLLEFLDPEITESLQYQLRQKGMTLRLGEKVTSVEVADAPENTRSTDGKLVVATLESGKTIRSEGLLYCIGRAGQTDALNLEAIGLEADRRGRLSVNQNFQTAVPHIYAAGDVVGYPSLASTSMEQGRLAAVHMFNPDAVNRNAQQLFPFGIYAIPEISMVGLTEQAATEKDIPYECGIANYREIARSQLLGDDAGMLKLLIHQETREVLGAHAIGTGATELIHLAQAIIAHNGKVDYFADAVFNYPTLAECYKVAALNGMNKLSHVV